MSLGLSQLACVLTSRYRKARPGEHLPQTGRAAGPRQSSGVFNPTPRRQTSSAPIRKRISPTASCVWQIYRLAPSIASAATNTCCGGKRDRLCFRWSRWSAASERRAVQPFHSRSGGASPVPCPKSSGEHLRGQCRARRSLLWRLLDLHSTVAILWPPSKVGNEVAVEGCLYQRARDRQGNSPKSAAADTHQPDESAAKTTAKTMAI